MDFRDILYKYNLDSLLDVVQYKPFKFNNSDRVYKFLDDILTNNRKTLVYGDYDADGINCVLGWKEAFQQLDYNNYSVFKYNKRTHKLDPKALYEAIEGNFDYIIISDTASSEMDKLISLVKLGVKVIVLDHHQTEFEYKDYPSDVAIINTMIENRMLGEPRYALSAGALVFTVLDYYLQDRYKKDVEELSCYALASLYADCMDMSNRLNRSIYYKATRVNRLHLPVYISSFLQEYIKFNRRFIEYHYSPKINSLFRSERFDYLNELFLTEGSDYKNVPSRLVEDISNIHFASSELVDKLTDIIEVVEMNNFVVGNLNSVDRYFDVLKYKVYNYTGLVANRLGNRYHKPAIVYCCTDTDIKGSFRDFLGRNYLKVFKTFCDANGHPPAFGFVIGRYDFDRWFRSLSIIDRTSKFKEIDSRYIEIPHKYDEPDELLLDEMARYNEFSGNLTPVAVISKMCTVTMREVPNPYGGYKYLWNGYTIRSSSRLIRGQTYLFKPTRIVKVNLYVV